MNTNTVDEGVFAALYLPCDSEGRLMREAIEAHLSWLRAKGVEGVLALGSTGEFPLMTVGERQEALDVVAEFSGDLKVIANVSDLNPRAVATLAKHSRSLGLAGVAIMPPNFYPSSDDEQLSFFLRASESAEIPFMLYNFPELTGNRIAPTTVAAFADQAPMFGIKQSGGEFDYHRELIQIGGEKGFSVFSGADTRLPEVFELGAKGCIGGLVNFVPEYMVEIYRICRKGSSGNLDTLSSRMKEVGALVDRMNFPVNVGIGLAARGFEAGAARTHVSGTARVQFRRLVVEARSLFEKWDLAPAYPAPATS